MFLTTFGQIFSGSEMHDKKPLVQRTKTGTLDKHDEAIKEVQDDKDGARRILADDDCPPK